MKKKEIQDAVSDSIIEMLDGWLDKLESDVQKIVKVQLQPALKIVARRKAPKTLRGTGLIHTTRATYLAANLIELEAKIDVLQRARYNIEWMKSKK